MDCDDINDFECGVQSLICTVHHSVDVLFISRSRLRPFVGTRQERSCVRRYRSRNVNGRCSYESRTPNLTRTLQLAVRFSLANSIIIIGTMIDEIIRSACMGTRVHRSGWGISMIRAHRSWSRCIYIPLCSHQRCPCPQNLKH